jgi:hypothetical protein
MQLFRQCRATAFHAYSRESITAIPRIRASGRLQAWRAADAQASVPARGARIIALPAATPALQLAA